MEKSNEKVALVTGGSKGIGYGVAEALLRQGYKVAITSRSLSHAQEAADKLSLSDKDKVLALEADVRSLEEQQNAVQEILDQWGRLDVLIANAGLGHFAPISELSASQWEETIDTNLTGVFYSVKASLDAIKKQKGYIITISSLAGTNFFAGGTAYNASKFGLTGFTQALMLDVRSDDVKVTTIMPGSVATHFNGNEPSSKDAWKIQIEDMGKLVIDLLTMHPRTLPSKVEVRPSRPPSSK
ncbi:SDR family oxidoreductase [Croceiramulus getboli]|nr:SDR family oxidoreductase [Flavobacteriaceae bacterium YJPT1-3]